jgi:hypothetical protein
MTDAFRWIHKRAAAVQMRNEENSPLLKEDRRGDEALVA